MFIHACLLCVCTRMRMYADGWVCVCVRMCVCYGWEIVELVQYIADIDNVIVTKNYYHDCVMLS